MDNPLIDRLAALPVLRDAPHSELAWFAARARVQTHDVGKRLFEFGQPVDDLFIVLSGRIVFYTESTTRRHLYEWGPGQISGAMPFSRMRTAPGVGFAEQTAEVLTFHREHFPQLIHECPRLTTICVHELLERVRLNVRNELHDDKMSSLGRLSAGLAHELNNPASGASRSANLLIDALRAVETTTEGLSILTPEQKSTIARARDEALRSGAAHERSALAEAEREDAVAAWCAAHDIESALAAELVDAHVTAEMLDSLAHLLPRAPLEAGLRWLAATCTARSLAGNIRRATARIHDLVSSVKRYTNMDRAVVREPVLVEQGIHDSVGVLAAKARVRSITVDLDLPALLPPVHAYADELNQVWTNLLDNALDAARSRVTISALVNGELVMVRVADDGPGIPEHVQPHVFEPFFTTKPIGEATGLGLDAVQRIVQRHEGTVSFVSSTGHTEFCVTLPQAG